MSLCSGTDKKQINEKQINGKQINGKEIFEEDLLKREDMELERLENVPSSEDVDVEEIDMSGWSRLRLHSLLMKALMKLKFSNPTPIQEACIGAAAFQGKVCRQYSPCIFSSVSVGDLRFNHYLLRILVPVHALSLEFCYDCPGCHRCR